MTIFYSPSRRGFFDPEVHRQIPEDGVRVTPKRHRELLAAQEEGAQIVPGEDGRPKLLWPERSLAAGRAELVRRVRREARRRIEAISPPWRQLNDLRAPTPQGQARFAAIDAIRDASTAIEAEAVRATRSELDGFTVRDNPLWPREETFDG